MSSLASSTYGKVAVLAGGWSAERDISLQSGKTVLQGLLDAGVDATPIDPTPERLLGLKAEGVDRVFNILHGTPGEDGLLQAACQLQGLPVTGCGMQAAANSLDKAATKALWQHAGLPVAADVVVRRGESFDVSAIVAKLGLPVFVKPAREGSSVGITRVTDKHQLEAAIGNALSRGKAVLIEAEIVGDEYSAGFVGTVQLPPVGIRAQSGFYDYDAKYVSDDTAYLLPSGLDAETESRCQALCAKAADVLGAAGWGRTDFMVDRNGEPVLIELNTTPGMTSHSLIPKSAAAHGWDLPMLMTKILDTAEVPQ